jgi:hypothetical protein
VLDMKINLNLQAAKVLVKRSRFYSYAHRVIGLHKSRDSEY